VPDQISFRELLQDPLFKQWTMKSPKLKVTVATGAPWFVYVKREGRWARKEFSTYARAFNWLIKRLKAGEIEDAAIHCKRQWFLPPRVRVEGRRTYWPMPPNHRWCGLCRRPVVYNTFSKHHAMPPYSASYEPRCTICGARQTMTREYPSVLRSRFV
jgi:hypothetical protein